MFGVNDAPMKCSDFAIGQEFWCDGKRWRCTDIGTRVIVATCLEPHEIVTRLPGDRPGDPRRVVRSIADDPKWRTGPPYAVCESVFDEHDTQGCSVTSNV
jgi:hypothetical protein